MIYKLYADEIEITNMISAKLKKKINDFDYMEFKLNSNHPLIGSILNKKTIIILKADGNLRFIGRVNVQSFDLYNQCKFECDSIASKLKETFFSPVPTQYNAPLRPYSMNESLGLIETSHNLQETNENLQLELSYDYYDTKAWYATISFLDSLIQVALVDMFSGNGFQICDRTDEEFTVVDTFQTTSSVTKNYFVEGSGTIKIYSCISTDFTTLQSYVNVSVNGGTAQKLWMGDNLVQLSIGMNTLVFSIPVFINEGSRNLTINVRYRDEPLLEYFNRKEYQTCWNALISKNENNPQIYQNYSLYTLFNFVIRYTDTKIYLDFYNNRSVIPTLSQSITMNNLLSITKTLDASTMVNSIIPLGATYEELGIGGSKRLSLMDSSSFTVPYVEDSTLVAAFGRITDVVVFDGIKKAVADEDSDSNLLDNLEALGNEELDKRLNEDITIEIEAIDLSLINPTLDQFDIGRKVLVNLPLYGINNMTLMIDEVEWDLLNPSTNKLTLGTTIKSLTEQIRDSK